MSQRTEVPRTLLFEGRPGDPRIGQWVKPIRSLPKPTPGKENIVLVGCPDDTGVRWNRGRAGAQEGPDAIRKHLYKMTLPMDSRLEEKVLFFDYGNLIPGRNISETHRSAFAAAQEIGTRGFTMIVLGGGHDFAAPNFLGFFEGCESAYAKSKTKWALLNVDPHLDVRPLEKQGPHSGTPFRQILEDDAIDPKLFLEFGIRPNRNARDHYEYCKKKKVNLRTLEQIRGGATAVDKQYERFLTTFKKRATHIGVTFDMDSCSDAEGTSAAPVLGFSAWELYRMACLAGKESKVNYFEIAEVAPPLETHDRAARIAAEMIFGFLSNRH